MIEVKLTFKDFAEAQAFFNRDAMTVATGDAARELLAGAAALNDIPAEVQEAAAPAKRARKSKNAEAEQAQAAPAAVAPEQEATAEPKEEVIQLHTLETVDAEIVQDKSYTVDDVRKALQAYSGREGFPAATELVKSFGATRITELKAEDYAAFIAKTEEKVAA
jgi:hypothetical protein